MWSSPALKLARSETRLLCISTNVQLTSCAARSMRSRPLHISNAAQLELCEVLALRSSHAAATLPFNSSPDAQTAR
jgi:hypothetical protein